MASHEVDAAMRILYTFIAIAVVLTPHAVAAVELGDPKRGLAYAGKTCAECHAVKAGDKNSPNPDAPSFEAVANTQGITRLALVVWLQTSHRTMPNLMVPPEDRDDVIAYIMSLHAGGERGDATP